MAAGSPAAEKPVPPMVSSLQETLGDVQAVGRAEQIAAAATGGSTDFAGHHLPLIRRRLRSRWRGSALRGLCDDAAQEVLLECVREHGALTRVDAARPGGLDAFLCGVVDNIARRVERREGRRRRLMSGIDPETLPATRPSPGDAIDRSWIHDKVAEAVRLLGQEKPASTIGHSLAELVDLHFWQGLPIRAIASRWGQPAQRVHELRRQACEHVHKRLAQVIHGTSRRRAGSTADGRWRRLLTESLA